MPAKKREREEETTEKEVDPAAEKAAQAKARANTRSRGFRTQSKKAGYDVAVKTGENVNCVESAIRDQLSSIVTVSAIKRMLDFIPHDTTKLSYSEEEYALRLRNWEEAKPDSALKELVPFVEELARRVCVDATFRALDGSSRLRVGAYEGYAATRDLLTNMQFSSAFPRGLIRSAQKTKICMRKFDEPGDDGKYVIDPDSGRMALGSFEEDADVESQEMTELPAITKLFKSAKAKKDAAREERKRRYADRRKKSAGSASQEEVPSL